MNLIIKRGRLVLAAALLWPVVSNAQQVLEGSAAAAKVPGAQTVRTGKFSDNPTFIRLAKGEEIPFAQWKTWMTQKLGLDFMYDFTLITSDHDKLGHVHYRYQETYNGKPVENGKWNLHTLNGHVYSMNGLLYNAIHTSAAPALSASAALDKAKAWMGAEVYKWELAAEEQHLKDETGNPGATYFPTGTLVYTSPRGKLNDADIHLCYKFNIYAHKPLARKEVYVDATTGEIIFEDQVLHDADVTGTAITAYSGTQTITTDSFAGGFRLREAGRGNGIRTYNMQTGTTYGSAVDFTDADNTWNNVNAQQDEVATDAHWGAEMTYDYYNVMHGRNSIDNAGFALYSYVHYDVGYNNAFWDGQRMTYGDGSGAYNPFTALDITGHEITHGLDEFTANLDYQDESGALNESFSDIFGVTIEWFALPASANWLMGENIGVVIRSMSNPGAYGDPDTYFGNNWAALGGADNGGVHTNSGVQNFWYYLLCNGGTGTNDNGSAYTVNGIGMNNAADIAYRNLTVYLVNTSQYADARFYAIQSAIDLFGGCTPEVEATTNAWYAVGVGPQYVATVTAAFAPNTNGGCSNPMTVSFANSSNNGVTYSWDFGDGGTSTQTNPSHTYTSNGVYTVSLIADGGLCGIDTLVVTNQIFVGQLPDPVVTDAGRCDPGTVALNASGAGQLSWYTTPTGGSAVATGSSYTTPSISSTTTYYVESQTGLVPENVGPVDNTFGGGGYFNGDRWLIFDAYRPFTLNSVWVDAGSGGNRTIELRDNAGTVIQSAVVNIPAGQGRINLNFNVPVGTNMQLGVANGSNPDLYRNNANAAYPYAIPGLVSITNSNAGVPGYYYFFYDWEIQEIPCASDRVPVVAGIATAPSVTNASRCGTGNVTLSATGSTGTLNWYDAPTGGNLVNTGPTYNVALSSTTSFYVEEDLTPAAEYVGPVDNTFGGGGYFNGDQHLVFDVTTACTLNSVLVYANTAGNRTIELRNNAGGVIQSTVVNIPAGQSRITLNFALTPGTGYQLGWLAGSSPDLFRNNSGGPAYPFTLSSGAVSITSSSAGNAYYYCFYDWEIQLPGCITARTTVTGTVNPAFDATITPSGPFCASDGPTTLVAADGGGVWSGTGITNPSTGTFDPGTAGAGTFPVTYMISGTCGDTSTVNIVVTNAFDATITSPGTLCTAGSLQNLVAVDNGGTWSGTGITSPSQGTFDPSSVVPGTYTVTYTIAGACGSTDTEDITVAQSADATITPLTTLCEDDAPVALTATDAGGTWSGTGVTGSSFDPAAAGAGAHVITYTITGTCGDADSIMVNVTALPNPAIVPPAGPYCSTIVSSTLTASPAGGTWSASCGTCINATTGEFNPAAAGVGTFALVYSVTNFCGTVNDTVFAVVGDCSGIGEQQISFGVTLIPNPAADVFQVLLQNAQGNPVQVEMMNSLGQLVKSQTGNVSSGPLYMDIRDVSPGVYYVNVTSGNYRVTEKLVKQ